MTIGLKQGLGRALALAAILVLPLSACESMRIWEARESTHCREVMYKLAEWTNAKKDPNPGQQLTAQRTVNGRQVRSVTIPYDQSGTRKLITCTYAASGKGPVLDVIFEGVHLTADDLSRLNKAVR